MRGVFLRHGESIGNVWGGAYRDDMTNFLSLRGIKQAELSAYTIKELLGNGDSFDAVITSELTRSRQTAVISMQTLGDWKRSYTLDDRLNEWCSNTPDVPGIPWYDHEPSEDFWSRINDFYMHVLVPMNDLPINVFVVSHYYVMQALFELIRKDLGLENTVGEDIDPNNEGDIPNAIPFFYDTELKLPPQIILPGHNDRSR